MHRVIIALLLCAVLWAQGCLAESLALSQAVEQPTPKNPLAPAAPVSASTLTLQEAIALALRQNPALFAARQRVEKARGELTAARSLPNPTMQVVPFGTINDNPYIATQMLDVVGKLGYRTQAARYSLQATQSERDAVELQVRYDAATAYVELQAAQQTQQLNEEATRLAREVHAATQQRLNAGDVPAVDPLRSEIELVRAEQALVKAKAETAVKRAALNTVMGRDPATPVVVENELPYQPRGWELEKLKEVALRTRPEVKAAQLELESRKALVSLARAERNPNVLLQTRMGRAEGGSEVARTGVGFTFPLFDWGAIRGQTNAAKAGVAEQQALVTRQKQLVVLEVETAYHRLRAAQNVVESFQKSTLPRSEDLLRRVRSGYPEGVTILQLIDAQRTYTEGRLGYTQAFVEYQRSLFELERAVGGKLNFGLREESR